MDKWDEQHQADLLRAMYRVGLLSRDELGTMIDRLQVRILQASDQDKYPRTRLRYDGH